MRWLDFGARNRLSDKGCHPFYEFPYDSAKICSFSLFAKPVLINFQKVYQNGYSSLNSAILYNVSLYFHYKDPSLPLRMTPKSCKYNKYPGPCPRKQPFSWTRDPLSVF